MSALEAMQGVQATFTSDEIYAHLMSFEEILKQTGELTHTFKAIAFSTHNHPNTSSSQFTTDRFVQRRDHESSKDALLLSKIFLKYAKF
jgi:hypothetical protein